jgi:hypothetical protein
VQFRSQVLHCTAAGCHYQAEVVAWCLAWPTYFLSICAEHVLWKHFWLALCCNRKLVVLLSHHRLRRPQVARQLVSWLNPPKPSPKSGDLEYEMLGAAKEIIVVGLHQPFDSQGKLAQLLA